jgi:hypothetical protein
MRSWRPVDTYLHSPEWFGYGTVLAMAVLAGLGVEAWTARRTRRERLTMVAPGVVLWLVAPAALGAGATALVPVWVGALAAAAALVLATGPSAFAWLIPAALAVELVTNGLTGDPLATLPFGPVPKLLRAIPPPTVDPAADLQEGPLVRALSTADGRYLTVASGGLAGDEVDAFPDQALLFDVESTGGYNAVQLLRPWVFVRAVQDRYVRYNRATFTSAPPLALDLLDVHALVLPATSSPQSGAILGAEDGLVAVRVPNPPTRASLVTSWRVVGEDRRAYPNRALDAVLAPGFDPDGTIVLERDPGIETPSAGGGTATYRSEGMGAARVEVDSPDGGVVLIRTPWERGWHAEVDGEPAELLRADYLLQGVAVPAGHHVVELRYDDPATRYGLAGSAAAGAALSIAVAIAYRRRRPQGPHPRSREDRASERTA